MERIGDENQVNIQKAMDPDAIAGNFLLSVDPRNLDSEIILEQSQALAEKLAEDGDIPPYLKLSDTPRNRLSRLINIKYVEHVNNLRFANLFGDKHNPITVMGMDPYSEKIRSYYQNTAAESGLNQNDINQIVGALKAPSLTETNDATPASVYHAMISRPLFKHQAAYFDPRKGSWTRFVMYPIEEYSGGRQVVVEVNNDLELAGKGKLATAEAESTHLKTALAASEEKNQELLQRVNDLTEITELSAEFVGTATHDLRNPLTTVISQADFALRSWETKPEQAKISLEAILKSGWRMNQKISEIVKKAEMLQPPKPQVLDAKIFLKLVSLDEDIVQLANDRNIQINFEFPEEEIKFMGDYGLLTIGVFNTLILNSIQAGEGREDLVITLGCKREGEKTLLYVKDNGSGMPEEVIKRCFDPGYSVKSQESSGMGLSNAKKLLRYYKGEFLTPESKVNVGTKMTVAFPLCK